MELPDDLSNSNITLNANSTYGGYQNIALSDIYNGTFSTIENNSDTSLDFGNANDAYKSKFGYLVTGYNPSSGTNWRLFYADSNNAYLIADILEPKAMNSFSWFGTSIISDLGKNLNKKYTETSSWELESSYFGLNNNIKAVTALLDTTKWTDYKTDEANWAVGSPSLEMFVASYNVTHTIQIDSTVESATSAGYKVGINTSGGAVENYNVYISGLGNSENVDKAIYCPASNYWLLASPSADSAPGDNLMSVGSGGSGMLTVVHYQSNSSTRPLVSVPISKIEDGTITITNKYFND